MAMISSASQRAIDRTWRAVAPTNRSSANSRPCRSAIIVSVEPGRLKCQMFCTPTMPVIFVPSLNEVTILMPDGGAVIASQVPFPR
jgi:hypothetical protein